jgi:methyltransferase (TIGR00027 family)
MALSRAIETRRVADDRVCSDPLAERLLDRRYRAALIARPVREAAVALIERLFPGHHHYVLVRTRYFDDLLVEHAGAVEQLVVLGAGFDSRAHRFADRLRDVAVFEVDHPATSRTKQERITGIATGRVTYVPVDFDRDSLGDRLASAGYRTDRRTLFLWEGVTPYLSAAGVAATLDWIRGASAPGSRLIFDYVLSSVLDDTCTMRGARNERARMQRTPEPFVFGLDPARIGVFLADHGLVDAIDVGGDALGARYLTGARRGRYVKPWWRIVHARVG